MTNKFTWNDKKLRKKKILVIQMENAREIIASTPAIEEINSRHNDAVIEVLLLEHVKELMEGNPYVDVIHAIPQSVFIKMNEVLDKERNEIFDEVYANNILDSLGEFDFIFNFSHDMFSSWLTENLYSKVKKGGRILANGPWIYSCPWQSYYVARTSFRQLDYMNIVDIMRGMNYSNELERGSYYVNTESGLFDENNEMAAYLENNNVIAFYFNDSTHKYFNVDEMAKLIRLLSKDGYTPAFIGFDYHTNRLVEQNLKTGNKPIESIDLTGKLSITEIGAFLEKCKLLVTNDVFLPNIAAAAGIKNVVIYGEHGMYKHNSPWGSGNIVIDIEPDTELYYKLYGENVYECVGYALGKKRPQDINKSLKNSAVKVYETSFMDKEIDGLGGLIYTPFVQEKTDIQNLYAELLRIFLTRALCGIEPAVENSPAVNKYLESKYEIDSKQLKEISFVLEEAARYIRFLEMDYRKWIVVLKKAFSNNKPKLGADKNIDIEETESELKKEKISQEIAEKEAKLDKLAQKYNFIHPLIMTLSWEIKMIQEGDYGEILDEVSRKYSKYASVLEAQIEVIKRN